jgi:alkylhydroperoxidase family enzyme
MCLAAGVTEPRLAPLDPDAALAAARAHGLPDQYANPTVFRVLLRHPELAARVGALLHQLMNSTVLDPALRELAILRIGWVLRAEYEWTQHYKVARRVGLLDEEIAIVRDFPHAAAPRGGAGAAVLRATDEILADGGVGDHTWEQLVQHLGSAEAAVELLVVVSNWRTFAVVLNTLRIPNDPDDAHWPPDGRRPDGLAD